jgi:stage III sporulation protein AG
MMQKDNNWQEAWQSPLSGVWERLGKNRLLLIGLVGIVALLAMQLLWPDQHVNNPIPNAVPVEKPAALQGELQEINQYRTALEDQLAKTLSSIQGVGKVSVMLSLASGPEAIPAMNIQTSQKTTEKKDANGGTRVIQEDSRTSSLVTAGDDRLVTLQENLPPVSGVVIVAQGAASADVRLALTRAVETVLNIAAYRIQVIPGK